MSRFLALAAVLILAAACEKEAPPPQAADLDKANQCFQDREWKCAASNYYGYLQKYPNDRDAAAKLAMSATHSGQHDVAIPAYKKAEELGVSTYDFFAQYAKSAEAMGDLDLAIRANRKSLEIVPTLVDVRGDLAAQLVRKGQVDEAIKLLEDFDKDLKSKGHSPYFTAQIKSIREKAGK